MRTHAGSHYLDKQDAMSAITAQSHLVSQHMDAIAAIMKRGLGEDALENERIRTAAAIKLASEGHAIASSSDAAVVNEAQSGEYGRDCATANGMNQAQTMENKWSLGECQVCFAKTMVGSCAVCASCARADDNGMDLLKLREYNLRRRQTSQAIGAQSTKRILETPKPPKHELIKQQYGQYAEIRHVLTIGGAYKEVFDRRSNEILAQIN